MSERFKITPATVSMLRKNESFYNKQSSLSGKFTILSQNRKV